ncbi:MAG: response regulator [Rhodocyclaceae bacterium]|nr:response regulator [Rhodocyclaceae bacterium]
MNPTDAPHPRKMLICDDNPVNRKVAVAFATRMGFEVSEVAGGAAALELLAAQQFDILLLDISMPGMSGDEVLAHYLASDPTPRPRILAYTAHAFPEEKARLLAAGFDDLLIKPVSLAALQSACR